VVNVFSCELNVKTPSNAIEKWFEINPKIKKTIAI
jgi:hypothetical protein